MSKLDELEQKIKELKSKIQAEKAPKSSSKGLRYGAIFNISIEIVAHLIAGVVVGLMLDKYFQTKNIFLIICLIFSIIAACKNIIAGKNIL
ncbi:hypothetical protein phytr_3860 [Candidatus Phycorickettsia trachydisci]|uniref:ATP synthase protein I n=1 Tax=Candidatus Phycorickettsia trachydisci TaxID=2115978 RepID=A0A2P1P7U8_9RICK|nr:AtpZ/AtpI family protein [Candidatus Phycorickettsia trachydisci]AVP87337.1 hypothetical protein phytr_3860 [Candidatus Phycorickettsia trachydisci]